MKPIEVQSGGITDTGNLRADNQDQFLVAELTRSMTVRSGSMEFDHGARLVGGSLGHLFVVADGMGGHRSGSEASKFAVQYCANAILNSTRGLLQMEPSNEDSFAEDLKSMLTNAHRAIEERSKSDDRFEGMGTTLTLAYVAWPRIFIVHAGDTRCYLLQNGELKLITRDHTVANQMLESGHLAPEELERSHWSNVLV
ncbi:MAG: protein phosphatase 2C domain-containing protein, partial [Pirellula sp.]